MFSSLIMVFPAKFTKCIFFPFVRHFENWWYLPKRECDSAIQNEWWSLGFLWSPTYYLIRRQREIYQKKLIYQKKRFFKFPQINYCYQNKYQPVFVHFSLITKRALPCLPLLLWYSVLLRPMANARNVSKLKFDFVTVFQISLYCHCLSA